MNTTRIILLILFLFSSMTFAQEDHGGNSDKRNSQLLSVLRTEFRTQNPAINGIEIFDIRPLQLDPIINNPERPNHFLILASGDGQFGLFLCDDSLFAVERTIALISPPPVSSSSSFVVKIEKIWKDSVTVRGFDTQLDQISFSKRYRLLR